MKLRTSYDKNFALPVILTADDLSTLYSFLGEHYPKIEISAVCLDDISRTFPDMATLIRYENSAGKRLLSLTLSFEDSHYIERGKLRIGDSYKYNVALELRGEEDNVDLVKSYILEKFDGTKPWYSGFSLFYFRFGDVLPMALLLLAIFMLSIYSTLFAATNTKATTVNVHIPNTAELLYISIGVLAVLLFCGISAVMSWKYLDRQAKKAMPMTVFLIGAAVRRHENLEVWRIGVIAALIIAILGGGISIYLF